MPISPRAHKVLEMLRTVGRLFKVAKKALAPRAGLTPAMPISYLSGYAAYKKRQASLAIWPAADHGYFFLLSPHARYLLVPGRIPFFQALHFGFSYGAFYSARDRHFTKAPKAGYNYQHPNRKTEHYITAFLKIEPGQCETERLCLQMGDSLPPARVPVKVSRGIDGHKKAGPKACFIWRHCLGRASPRIGGIWSCNGQFCPVLTLPMYHR